MKVSVSIPEDDLSFIDQYASEHDVESRSAVVQRAVSLLRASELGQDYAAPVQVAAAEAPAVAHRNGAPRDKDDSLGISVERHLAELFKSYGDGLPPPGLYHRVLREIEYPLLSAALAATRGNQIKAAELLGLNRNTLRKKVRDLDIRLMRLPR